MQQSQQPPKLTAEDFAFSRLIAYAALQYPSYQTAPHHRLIARKLEAVERGEIKRLMIFMPPRHGKSMLASEFFPAWYLGRNPDKYVIAASYAQELSDDFGRKVRNQLLDTTFQAVFPECKIRQDSQSARRFNTEQGGAYFAVGVGGPVTGRGAHLLLIDDPVKNREDAESETIRRKIVEWYTSTAYTRLMKDGAIVIIQTRWHEDDLSGWIMDNSKHEGWEILNLPAIDDDNNALWPEQYPLERLEEIRSTIGVRDWTALYQQRPAPEEGDFFKREWFRMYDQAPAHLRIYGTSDYATKEGKGDWTVHAVWGVDPDSNIYLLDLWRGQTDSLVWVEQLINLGRMWRPLEWGEESGQIINSVGPLIEKRQRETSVFFYRNQYPSTADKSVRAQAIRGYMAAGKVYFPCNAPWLADYISEMLSFPSGKHDDQVDATSLLGRMLARLLDAEAPKTKPLESLLRKPTLDELTADFDRRMQMESESQNLS
jgi:predicted phage terminase large subunit-like protein